MTNFKEERKRAYANQIKGHIDLIYELTNGVEFKETWKQFNNRSLDETVTALVKRGVLKKKTWYEGNRGARYSFTWSSSMAPTSILVNNIIKDIREKRREKDRRHKEKIALGIKQEQQQVHNKLEDTIKEIAKPEPMIEKESESKDIRKMSIEGYCDKELWEELKKRGYVIEDNKLVRITKIYLD